MAHLETFKPSHSFSFADPLDSRLYVDLIYQAFSHFASFTPASQVVLGDYGRVDKETGMFEREGNVLREITSWKRDKDVVKNGEKGSGSGSGLDVDGTELLKLIGDPIETPQQTMTISRSRKTGKSLSVDLDPNVASLSLLFKTSFDFSKDRLALLIMIDPVLVQLPYLGPLERFLLHKSNSHLWGKALVTKLYKCTSYVTFISTSKSGKASFELNAQLPFPVLAGPVPIQPKADTSFGWSSDVKGGVFSTGVYEKGNWRYFPLFALKTFKYGFLGGMIRSGSRSEASSLKPAWEDAERPWGELGEDGKDLDEEVDEEEVEEDEEE